MNYELNLTTSRLCRTPPIHCVAGGELGLTHGLNRTTGATRVSCYPQEDNWGWWAKTPALLEEIGEVARSDGGVNNFIMRNYILFFFWPPPPFGVLLLKIAKQFSRGELLLSLAPLFLLFFCEKQEESWGWRLLMRSAECRIYLMISVEFIDIR